MKIEKDLEAKLVEIGEKLNADLAVEEAQSTYAIAETEVEHRATMTEIAAQPRPQQDRNDG